MSTTTDTTPITRVDRVRRRIFVTGVVQGVGFRPFVYVTATELGLSGSVTNDSAGVLIEVEGDEANVAELTRRITAESPPLARVDAIVANDICCEGESGFAIRESSRTGVGRTLASPDVATCPACLVELADPSNRRFRHPFITCTNCGPRFTVITDLPYDRPLTTMAGFPMCSTCAAEYNDPFDRRFHAQTIACLDCGPRLTLVCPNRSSRSDDRALAGARQMLAEGAILAVKGIGGYHLMCDATDEIAVAELRRRKRRGDKPFAVMVADLNEARRHAEINDEEAKLLESFARPIVLVRRRPDDSDIAASVAPSVPDLGLMLAYTPVHALLFGLPGDWPGPRALVATSGNLSGEPIVADDAEALSRLGPLVDGWLSHDRPIHVPCDDSVLRIVDSEQLPLRRARGYAPMPITLPNEVEPTLATGADLKNTCCLAKGRRAWVSQHIGDMDDMATLRAFAKTETLLETLTDVAPTELVADAHPGYRSTGWARQNAQGRRVHSVQHHHAHVASLLGENEIAAETAIIGVAFDGTGFGSDGAVWGGEVLIADYNDFERFAHLKYVPVPGGDIAVERPYRMALSHLSSAGIDWDDDIASVSACPNNEVNVLARQLAAGFGCVPTSSMGRLFDAVASLCDVRQIIEYEAQAAIELEALARMAPEEAWDTDCYKFDLDLTGGETRCAVERCAIEIDAAPVIRQIVSDLRQGSTPTDVSVRFHGGVVGLVDAIARRAREIFDLNVVGLTGGVFQNPVLLSRSTKTLRDSGFTVLRHRVVPPNDGGLALGQILAASNRSTAKGGPSCV